MSCSPKYCVLKSCFDRLVIGVKSVVGKVARKAFEKDLISAQSLQEAEKELTDQEIRTSQLLQLILSKVELNEVHFDTFIAIFESVPVLSELAEELNAELAKQEVQGSCDKELRTVTVGLLRTGDSPENVKFLGASKSLILKDNSDMAFAETLLTPSTSPDSEVISVEDEYSSLHFQCCCDGNCTLDMYLQSKCCGLLKKCFPHLNVEHLSNSDKYKLARKLISEANKMSEKFGDLVGEVFEVLEEQKTQVDPLIAVILTAGQQTLPKLIHEEHRDKLSALTSVSRVQTFIVKHGYVSFFNYRILEKIIERFAKPDNVLREKLQNYLAEFAEFCKRSVFEVPSVTIANLAPAYEPKKHLVLKVSERIWFGAVYKSSLSHSDFTFEDVITLEVKLASIIGVDEANFLLRDIKRGCVELTFNVLPSAVAKFPLTAVQLEQLSDLGIDIIVQPQNHSNTPQSVSGGNEITVAGNYSAKHDALVKMTSLKIKDLPPLVFRQLCQYLNISGLDGLRNWKDLASVAGLYTNLDIATLGHAGQRPNTNPAELLLFDFFARGVFLDQLYKMLDEIGAQECLNVLEKHVESLIQSSSDSSNTSSLETTPGPALSCSTGNSTDLEPTSQNVATPNIPYKELSEATEDFTKDVIAIGTFGTVFKANNLRGNGPFAIKKLHREKELMVGILFNELTHQEMITQELQLHTRYHHRNILSVVAYSNDGPRPCLVYEFMENGSLAEGLKGKYTMPWKWRLDTAKQIASALHFLHTIDKPRCLVHGNLKSANILLDTQLVPKLSGFSLARESQLKQNRGIEKSTLSTESVNVIRAMAYLPPEFLRNRKFKPSIDVYSFGVVMLELYTGQPAFDDDLFQKKRLQLIDRLDDLIEDSDLHQQKILTLADVQASWPTPTSLELFDIITVCLSHKAKHRPPMEQVIDMLQMIERTELE